MKRALILGLGLLAAPAAVAQSPAPMPVSVYPGTFVRVAAAQEAKSPKPLAPAEPAAPPTPAAAPPLIQATPPMAVAPTGPLQPLAGLLAMPLPTAPTVAAGMCASGSCSPACGAPLFSTMSRDGSGKSRPCLDRVVNWLTWHPGPSVLPVLTPTPYQSPLRDYFPCVPQKSTGGPSCAATAGRADGTCNTRPASGLGLFSRSGCAAPATPVGYAFVPVVISLPPTCGGYSAMSGGRCAMDRLMTLFSCGTYRNEVTTAGCATGRGANCGSAAASYYYANPTGSQPIR